MNTDEHCFSNSSEFIGVHPWFEPVLSRRPAFDLSIVRCLLLCFGIGLTLHGPIVGCLLLPLGIRFAALHALRLSFLGFIRAPIRPLALRLMLPLRLTRSSP